MNRRKHSPSEGQTFGKFTFIRELPQRYKNSRYALFKCSCGREVESNLLLVIQGRTNSCRSCAAKIRKTQHGHCINGRQTSTYECWSAMHKRCSNPEHPSYKDYGGRGVSVCERWNDFANFLADMGEKPSGKSIDRFPDPNGSYKTDNCRWATAKEQNNNKRGNTVLEFSGKRLTISQWSEETGIKDCTLSERLRHGWSVERALTTPTYNRGRLA